MLADRVIIKRNQQRQLAGKGGNSKVSKQQVRDMIRSELADVIEDKVTYTTQNGGVSYNGQVASLTAALARADTAVDAFTGNLIKPKRVRVKGNVTTNQTYNSIRIIIFQWRDASVPTTSGILNTTGSVLAPFSPLLWTNVHKVHILADQLLTIFPVAGSYAAEGFNMEISSGMKPIQFASGSTTPQMNGLYCLLISDDGAPSYPDVNYVSEVIFSDA